MVKYLWSFSCLCAFSILGFWSRALLLWLCVWVEQAPSNSATFPRDLLYFRDRHQSVGVVNPLGRLGIAIVVWANQIQPVFHWAGPVLGGFHGEPLPVLAEVGHISATSTATWSWSCFMGIYPVQKKTCRRENGQHEPIKFGWFIGSTCKDSLVCDMRPSNQSVL